MELRTATKIIVSNRDFVFADAHKELLDAWQYVIDTSQVAQLPNDQPYGRYNRTATRLIEAGILREAPVLSIPNKRTIDSVIYHWLRGKAEKAGSLWTDGESIYSYRMPIGYTNEDRRKILWNYTAKGLGFVSQTTSQHATCVSDIKHTHSLRNI